MSFGSCQKNSWRSARVTKTTPDKQEKNFIYPNGYKN